MTRVPVMHSVVAGTAAMVLMASPVAADCGESAQTFLSCTFNGGRTAVDVCVQDQTVSYSYGPPVGPPDLILSEAIKDIFYKPWNGLGRSIVEQVGFDNADYHYYVTGIYDRPQGDTVIDDPSIYDRGEIAIYNGRTRLAVLSCDPGSASFQFFLLADAKALSGQCMDHDAGLYRPCP